MSPVKKDIRTAAKKFKASRPVASGEPFFNRAIGNRVIVSIAKQPDRLNGRAGIFLLKISCEKCGAEVCTYQKDGPGNIRRMYIDRISKPKVSLGGKYILCPNKHLLGVKMMYEKEKRPIFRVFQDAITKKVVKI